ncbi:hypothetical protein ID866_8680 [Astraeus odoratus]|nr:hypothetical protein ID866_8680 [Astraeus odoratus]
MHKPAVNCGCPGVVTNNKRVQNLYQTPHPDCYSRR